LLAREKSLELLGALDVQALGHHEALAVVEVHAGEHQTERGVARQRPGGVAREHVDLARLQCGEALLGRQRHVARLVGVTQHGSGHRSAHVHIQPAVAPLAVCSRKTRQACADTAHQLAAFLDGFKVLAGMGRQGQQRGGSAQGQRGQLQGRGFHSVSPDW
jgi:hypothetical protein